jgi:hypothetical protein
MSYTNADGLLVLTNGDAGIPADNGRTAVFAKKNLIVKIDLTAGDKNFNAANDAFIPAGSFITEASLVVTTAAAGGTNVVIGLVNAAGAAIDADGITAAVTTANLAANKAVVCAGDLVAGTATIGAADGYVAIDTTGTFTAGEVLLVIEYIEP